MQIFGLPDEDDEASYANDAADDDDLDAYAQREHGKSKVVFNFEANTYSDDVYISHEMDDDEESVNRDVWNIWWLASSLIISIFQKITKTIPSVFVSLS